jgi:VCBS repeat-containing protein
VSGGATFALGATTVTCVATDDANNTSSDTFVVTVVDTTAPTLALPSPAPVHAINSAGAAVSFVASASDAVSGSTAVSCTLNGSPVSSGATFPIGTSTVNCASTDSHNNTRTGSFTATVTNTLPVAVANAYTTNANTPLTVAASGVLGNDSDADGDAITAAQVTGPAHGALSLNANGGFTYTPAAGYSGADSFTYRANDGRQNGNTVTVSLTIQSEAQVAQTTTAILTAIDPGLANDVSKIMTKQQTCLEVSKLIDKITKDNKYTAAQKAQMLAAVAALAQTVGCP